MTDPIPVEQAPDVFPMTLTEWQRLHRLLQMAHGKIVVNTAREARRGHDAIVLDIAPEVPIVLAPGVLDRFRTHGTGPLNLIGIALSGRDGLELIVSPASSAHTSPSDRQFVKINQVTNVQQVL